MIVKFAFRNTLRNRRRSLLTVISMGTGFFLLCVMIAMTEGSYNNMIDLFTRDHTGHIQIHQGDYLNRPSLYKTIKKPDNLIRELETLPDVVSVAPRIFGPSLAYGKEKTFPANVIGIDPDRESKATHLKSKVKKGVYLTDKMDESGYFPAMLGYTLAKNLNLTVGDELVLISQGIDGSIANDIFLVTAIVGSDTSNERMNVYLSLSAMNTFLSTSDQVHELVIILKHQSLSENFAKELSQKFSDSGLDIQPWQVIESAFYNGMQTDKKGNYISLAVLIFIVSIGVLNSILMGTLERTHEFGVLRAIGTRPRMVFQLIMLESSILAFASCLFGLIFSLPVIYWLVHVGLSLPEPIDMGGIPFQALKGELNWFSVLTPAASIFISTFIVSIYPAARAAVISPLEALQAV